uniref:Transposase n=1 Tax=uncultured bacterium BLR12 TaxID=506514 RepID=C0INF0_9BACT|nr:hypothetical protein AKSOIL_0221 [uncultured bacterium BLR12]
MKGMKNNIRVRRIRRHIFIAFVKLRCDELKALYLAVSA